LWDVPAVNRLVGVASKSIDQSDIDTAMEGGTTVDSWCRIGTRRSASFNDRRWLK